MLQRNSVLLRLGRSLSSAESAKEAAHIIANAASELFNWDACSLSLFFSEDRMLDQLYVVDTFDGKRTEISSPVATHPTPHYLKILHDGPELILRTPEEIVRASPPPFGNVKRRSASLMYVPLLECQKSIGMFTFQSYSFNAYNEDDLETLQSLADYCSGTLRRLRADQERKRIKEHNLVLLKLGKSLSSARNEKAAAQIIMEAATELFAWDACTIDLYLAERDLLQPLLVIDTIDGEKNIIADDLGSKPSLMARRVLQNGSELILRTAELINRTDGLPFGNGTQLSASIMNVSIRHAEKIIGILSFQSYTLNAYTHHDLRILELLADYCGGALERIRIETNLRSSEVRFHSIWESSVDGMRLTDENGTIVGVNEAYCKMVGMSRSDLEGKPFTVVYENDQELAKALIKYRIRFEKRILQRQVTRRMKFRDGKVVDLEDTNSFIELEDGKPVLLSLFRDITAQKQLQEELRQSQKMESIGQLAGGIAHDFNNILTIIGGHASLLLMDDGLNEQTRESVKQIANSTERAANLTRQLLAFSRKQMMQAKPLNMNDVVTDMTKILHRVLGEHICLQVSLHPGLPYIRADHSMMEQVLLNLAVNARDAMPQGGSLVIETSTLRVNDSDRHHPEIHTGDFICLRVRDTGCGIPAEFLPKIFEPFFTTKDVGKGTGLGLATVYGIVKQHRGFVRVNSELNRGTVFEIYFPQVSGGAGLKDAQTKTDLRGGSETILIVEDEKEVRTLVASMLKRLGYKCLEASSGVHALNLWRDYRSIVDLLLTDVVMPDGVSGRDLAQRLAADKPGLKIIYSSGYPKDAVGEDALYQEGVNFLQKPYQPQALARIVRASLDRRRQ